MLFQWKDMFVEILLELLISIVDVKLLKSVYLAIEIYKQVNFRVNITIASHKIHQCSKLTQNWITHVKVLKSKNIKNTNGTEAVIALDPLVNLVDEPFKCACIQIHGHWIPGVQCL